MTAIRVALAGAAGRMGEAVCAAVEGAGDLELSGRADPALGVELGSVLDGCDVVVDFTRPDTALGNSLLWGLPLLEADEVMARLDAVTLDDLGPLVDELWAPGRLWAAGIGPDEDAVRSAVAPVSGAVAA